MRTRATAGNRKARKQRRERLGGLRLQSVALLAPTVHGRAKVSGGGGGRGACLGKLRKLGLNPLKGVGIYIEPRGDRQRAQRKALRPHARHGRSARQRPGRGRPEQLAVLDARASAPRGEALRSRCGVAEGRGLGRGPAASEGGLVGRRQSGAGGAGGGGVERGALLLLKAKVAQPLPKVDLPRPAPPALRRQPAAGGAGGRGGGGVWAFVPAAF